jgi:hypothetical protein
MVLMVIVVVLRAIGTVSSRMSLSFYGSLGCFGSLPGLADAFLTSVEKIKI